MLVQQVHETGSVTAVADWMVVILKTNLSMPNVVDAMLVVVVLQMKKPLACAQESALERMVEEVANEEARHLVGDSLPNCAVELAVVLE